MKKNSIWSRVRNWISSKKLARKERLAKQARLRKERLAKQARLKEMQMIVDSVEPTDGPSNLQMPLDFGEKLESPYLISDRFSDGFLCDEFGVTKLKFVQTSNKDLVKYGSDEKVRYELDDEESNISEIQNKRPLEDRTKFFSKKYKFDHKYDQKHDDIDKQPN